MICPMRTINFHILCEDHYCSEGNIVEQFLTSEDNVPGTKQEAS